METAPERGGQGPSQRLSSGITRISARAAMGTTMNTLSGPERPAGADRVLDSPVVIR